MRDPEADPPTQPYPTRAPERSRENIRGGETDDAPVTAPRLRTDRPADTLVTPPAGAFAVGSLPPEPVLSGAIVTEDPTRMSGVYAMGDVIGRGGMGEVLRAHDRRIGRDVALKRLRTAAPAAEDVGRFLREARIQARLDHPAIVPVYELGKDELGRPFASRPISCTGTTAG